MELLKKYYQFFLTLLIFTIYIFTLAPSVIQIDSGELAAVQATLGIAHPTGYPLFTLTGHIFSLLPLPWTTIYQLNLLAALWCAAGTFFFVLTAELFLDNHHSFIKAKKVIVKTDRKEKKKNLVTLKKDEDISPPKKIIAITAGVLILSFSKTFWFQSTSVEVYSLQIFLFSLIIYFLFKAYLQEDNDLKSWLIFSAALALGFSNHMTTLLILPGTAYLFFNKNGFKKNAFKKIGLMLIIFFPVLFLIYSYLPIRAGQNPMINWGNPVDFEHIYRHITGKQYQVWLFSSSEAAKKQLEYFVNSLFNEFNISLLICLVGIAASFIAARKAFNFLLITFLSTVFYSINYNIIDIDSYFLLAYISLSFFSVYGTIKLLQWLKLKKYKHSLSAVLIGIFILLQFYFTIPKVNQSDNYTFEDYTKSLLNSTSRNSIILSYQWDYFISSSYYFQFVENYRKDVTVVDKELLRRSWYYNQLQNNYPGAIDGIKNNINLFLNAVQPFEREEAFNAGLLENIYQGIMTQLVETNADERDVYIGPELFEAEMQQGQFRLPEGYTLVPDLFLFKVVKGTQYVSAPDPNFNIRFHEKKDSYTTFIENVVGGMLVRRALYEMQFNKVDRAKLYIQKVREELPGYNIPPGIAEVLNK